VIEFVRVRKVVAIPGHQEVTTMVRRQSQMQRVADRIARHDLLRDVGANDVSNSRLHGHQRQVLDESQTILPGRKVAAGKFFDYRCARDEFIYVPGASQPFNASGALI
jgi:hypothetical protein